MKPFRFFLGMLCCLLATACGSDREPSNAAGPRITPATRIVSLNGALTEILCAIGYEKNIVGVDVTSTYPAAIAAKPKVGHARTLSAEGIVALKPDLVLGTEESAKPALADQLRAAGTRVLVFHADHTLEGAKSLIRAVTDSLGEGAKAEALVQAIDRDRAAAPVLASKPKVLFIYARGQGTLMVAGTATPASDIIALTGAQNAVTGYEGFKPLTSEALVAAAPDAILLFDTGLQSLGGTEGLLAVPGVAQTPAGKARRVIEMDGGLLLGFGPRTGEAIATLSRKLHETL